MEDFIVTGHYRTQGVVEVLTENYNVCFCYLMHCRALQRVLRKDRAYVRLVQY